MWFRSCMEMEMGVTTMLYKIRKIIDWVRFSDEAKIMFLVSVILGTPILLIVWTMPMGDPIGYLDSRGYRNVEIWTHEDVNCQRFYDGTVFYGNVNGVRTRGVLCESKWTDSVYVREF